MTDTIQICGLDVPRIGLGTLYLTEQRGFGAAKQGATALLLEAVELGVRFFDTADSYGPGAAEEAVRAALHPYDGLLITTKGGFRHERLGHWARDARPEHLRQALDGSLRRLGLDAIDLYQLHCPDPSVAYADSVGALARMQAQGKIRHIGISNVGLREIETARGEVEIVSVQNPFNVRSGHGGGVVRYCAENGIAFIPWMPLGDGGISWNDPGLVAVADKHAATPAQIALAALLRFSPAVLPIPGTGSVGHLRENVAAAEVELDEEDLARLWPS